jgi:hypothetical protein
LTGLISSAYNSPQTRTARLASLGQGTFPIHEVANSIKQIGWKVENEEKREELSRTGAEVIQPAYTAMKEAFSK